MAGDDTNDAGGAVVSPDGEAVAAPVVEEAPKPKKKRARRKKAEAAKPSGSSPGGYRVAVGSVIVRGVVYDSGSLIPDGRMTDETKATLLSKGRIVAA